MRVDAFKVERLLDKALVLLEVRFQQLQRVGQPLREESPVRGLALLQRLI